jgi:non-ribosomal peptide synthetase component E (peptide arylation enzyme)
VGNATNFVQVADAAACKPNGFYLSTDTIHLCTDTCAVVQGDEKAAINVLFACKGDIN